MGGILLRMMMRSGRFESRLVGGLGNLLCWSFIDVFWRAPGFWIPI